MFPNICIRSIQYAVAFGKSKPMAHTQPGIASLPCAQMIWAVLEGRNMQTLDQRSAWKIYTLGVPNHIFL